MTRTRVPARIGLLGNPSDGYGGRVIACTVDQLAATVEVEPHDGWVVGGVESTPVDGDVTARSDVASPEPGAFADIAELAECCRRFRDGGAHGFASGAELLAAAVVAFAASASGATDDAPLRPCRLGAVTSIPRQVGLSGSSAVVIGALVGLADVRGTVLDPVELARLALVAESEVLGITAGPQDRVVQAHGGAMDMDFATPWRADGYRRLDAGRLPPLVLAWQRGPGQPSAVVHGDVRARWERGDPLVRPTIAAFAVLADRGAAALREGDVAMLADLVDEAWELRTRIWDLAPVDVELVAVGRSVDAGVSLAGSGGAVVAVPRDGDAAQVVAAYRAAGHDALVVQAGAPTDRGPRPLRDDVRPVILAAGFGSRLAPLTDRTPKPLLTIGDRPLVGHLVHRLDAIGVGAPTIVVNGRHPDQYRAWATGPDVGPVRIVDNGVTTDHERPGAVVDLAAAISASADAVPGAAEGAAWLVVAGDNLVAADDLAAMVSAWRRHHRPVVGCRHLGDGPRGQYGEVTVDDTGRIVGFREKPPDPRSPIASTCTYVLPPDTPALIAEYLDAGGAPDAPGEFVGWLSRRRHVDALIFAGPYHDIGTHETLAAARSAFDTGDPAAGTAPS